MKRLNPATIRIPRPSLATRLIAFLGNNAPNEVQIRTMEALLLNAGLKTRLIFDERLSPGEINCLNLAALGHTIIETAEILKIGRRTVEQYWKSIKEKLNCRNMTQAAVQGIKYGYIKQSDQL